MLKLGLQPNYDIVIYIILQPLENKFYSIFNKSFVINLLKYEILRLKNMKIKLFLLYAKIFFNKLKLFKILIRNKNIFYIKIKHMGGCGSKNDVTGDENMNNFSY